MKPGSELMPRKPQMKLVFGASQTGRLLESLPPIHSIFC